MGINLLKPPRRPRVRSARRGEAYRYFLLIRAWPLGFRERVATVAGLLHQLVHWRSLRVGQAVELQLVDCGGSGPIWSIAPEQEGVSSWFPPDRGLRARGVVTKAGLGYYTVETGIGLTQTVSVWRSLWKELWRPLYPLGGRAFMKELADAHEKLNQLRKGDSQERSGRPTSGCS